MARRNDGRGTCHIPQTVFDEQETARLLKDDAQKNVRKIDLLQTKFTARLTHPKINKCYAQA